MGLYLCVFDGDEEVDGVEIGSYADFGDFRDAVGAAVGSELPGTALPVLQGHSDCDGSWSIADCAVLKSELETASKILGRKSPMAWPGSWQAGVAKSLGLEPAASLLECFIDVDGEPLVARLIGLCETALRAEEPILFQ